MNLPKENDFSSVSKMTVKLGEDHKNLEVSSTLICLTGVFKFSLCFRNCEGCVMGGVNVRKMSGNFSLWAHTQRKGLGSTSKD